MKRLFEPNSYTGVGLQPSAQINEMNQKMSMPPVSPLGQYIDNLYKDLSEQTELLQQLQGKVAPLLQYPIPNDMKIAGVIIREGQEGQSSPLRAQLEVLGMKISENNLTIARLTQAIDL